MVKLATLKDKLEGTYTTYGVTVRPGVPVLLSDELAELVKDDPMLALSDAPDDTPGEGRTAPKRGRKS